MKKKRKKYTKKLVFEKFRVTVNSVPKTRNCFKRSADMKKSIWTRVILDLTGILMVLIPALVIACKQPTVGDVSVTGVKLDQRELTLPAGKTAVLKATVEPADATVRSVSWSAEPADAVTLIDNKDGSCTVSAVKEVTATVTVTTADGGKTAQCAVTVSPLDFEYDETTKTYTVYTAKGLYAWAEAANVDLETNCVLAADIVLEKPAEGQSNWQPVGSEDDIAVAENRYKGTFDGRGYTIRNVTVNNSGSRNQGFFGVITGGAVKDVVLEDLSVTGGDNFVGGIAGQLIIGSVSGCYVKGSVRGMNFNVGGIVGNSSGKIEGCCFDGSVQGTKYVGGITGWADGVSSVKACRVKGVINGTDTVGGIAGGLQSGSSGSFVECIGCCADVQVTAVRDIGGVLGRTNIFGPAPPHPPPSPPPPLHHITHVPPHTRRPPPPPTRPHPAGARADFGWKFVCTDNSLPQPVRQ